MSFRTPEWIGMPACVNRQTGRSRFRSSDSALIFLSSANISMRRALSLSRLTSSYSAKGKRTTFGSPRLSTITSSLFCWTHSISEPSLFLASVAETVLGIFRLPFGAILAILLANIPATLLAVKSERTLRATVYLHERARACLGAGAVFVGGEGLVYDGEVLVELIEAAGADDGARHGLVAEHPA